MTLPDDTIEPAGDSSLSTTSGQISHSRKRVKEVDALKLRGNKCEEYQRFRKSSPEGNASRRSVPVKSGTRGLFTVEHYNATLEKIVVSNEAKVTNFEMLMTSRENELEGWAEFHVVREVHVDEIRRKKHVAFLTRWVDNWKVDLHGTGKLKSRLVIKGCQEDPSCLH